MYVYLQGIFSFCGTAESKNKIHAFDTTVVRDYGMSCDVSKFRCQEGGNVMIHKPHLTFHKNKEWIKMAETPPY